MNEGIQIYKFNDIMVYQQYFYNMTKLNFMYDRRNIFSFNKNGMQYNRYFPFDMVKENLKFYGLYLSAYSNVDSFLHMDFDFDIGFNNIKYKIEEKILDIIKDEFGKIDIIISIFNSRENKNIIDKINREYEVLFSLDGFYNIYIAELKEIKSINFIQEYIYGVLINEKNFSVSFGQCSFNQVDLKCIKQLAEKYELILFKVPIYANYNIVVYSSNENFIDKFSDNILNLKNSIFNIIFYWFSYNFLKKKDRIKSIDGDGLNSYKIKRAGKIIWMNCISRKYWS